MRLPYACMLASPALAILVAACGMDSVNADACSPGDFVRVTLDDGGTGFERCAADGGGYVPYDTSDGADPNAVPAPEADAATCDPSAGKLAFMCPGCATDSDCAGGLRCFPFNNKGPHCTHSCTSAADCPLPSGGCGNQAVCKPQ